MVLAVAYLEYTYRDLLQYHGWSSERIEQTERLYRELPEITQSLGLDYVDWREIVADETGESGSIFAAFGLYADHGHMSPAGNRRAAERVYTALEAR